MPSTRNKHGIYDEMSCEPLILNVTRFLSNIFNSSYSPFQTSLRHVSLVFGYSLFLLMVKSEFSSYSNKFDYSAYIWLKYMWIFRDLNDWYESVIDWNLSKNYTNFHILLSFLLYKITYILIKRHVYFIIIIRIIYYMKHYYWLYWRNLLESESDESPYPKRF